MSALSPWIRRRLITEEEVISAVLHRHSLAAAEKFIQEVFWRTYWKRWLEMRPATLSGFNTERLALKETLERDTSLRMAFERARRGETGIDCFDAWVQELIETGWLHNHARMWFASNWIFTLHLPWQLGADFFYKHLLDAEPRPTHYRGDGLRASRHAASIISRAPQTSVATALAGLIHAVS